MKKTVDPLAKLVLGYVLLVVGWAWLCWNWDHGKYIFVTMLFLSFTMIFMGMGVMHKNPRWLMLALGFFRRDLRPVVLYHWQGQDKVEYSLAQYDPDTHNWQCPIYWSTNTGCCVLKPNGLVDGSNGSSYIMYWRPLRKTELMMHLFTEVEHVWGDEL